MCQMELDGTIQDMHILMHYWETEPSSTYQIVDSATPLIITALALDSDNPNLINQSFASDSAQYNHYK